MMYVITCVGYVWECGRRNCIFSALRESGGIFVIVFKQLSLLVIVNIIVFLCVISPGIDWFGHEAL